ncbi:unnamed protein product [Xylocopa violacea]|uniref:Uncharacterized protein n=1 Tax=Xylocopa violacea TaxID=135666 RepID=A0ABP1PBX1_XYLVO
MSPEDSPPVIKSIVRPATLHFYPSLGERIFIPTSDGKTRARNKPADGVGHVNQKGSAGQKAPLAAGQKVAPGAKVAAKPAQKPSAQKGQVKVTPKAASVKTGKNKKKGQRQQYDLIVTINLMVARV